jgi:hypothetical protein
LARRIIGQEVVIGHKALDDLLQLILTRINAETEFVERRHVALERTNIIPLGATLGREGNAIIASGARTPREPGNETAEKRLRGHV